MSSSAAARRRAPPHSLAALITKPSLFTQYNCSSPTSPSRSLIPLIPPTLAATLALLSMASGSSLVERTPALEHDPSLVRPDVAGPDSGPPSPYPVYLDGWVTRGFGRGSKDLGCPTGASCSPSPLPRCSRPPAATHPTLAPLGQPTSPTRASPPMPPPCRRASTLASHASSTRRAHRATPLRAPSRRTRRGGFTTRCTPWS